MYRTDVTTEPCAPIGRSGKIVCASGVDYLHCGEERDVSQAYKTDYYRMMAALAVFSRPQTICFGANYILLTAG